MAKVLLVDVRTPSHVKTVSQILSSGDLDAYENLVVLAPENLSVPEWPAKLLTYNFVPSSYSSLFRILSFIKRIESFDDDPSTFSYLSAVNFGPLYDVLAARLQFEMQFLFEDGISSYLNLKVSFRWLKFSIITTVAGRYPRISSRKFFSGADDFATVIYTNKPLLVHALGSSAEIRPLPSSWSAADRKGTAIYLLSSSSVEYGLCSLERYEELMQRISQYYSGQSIIVSFHHNEYQADRKLDILKSLFQVERVVERGCAVENDMDKSGKMIELIAPFNSVALNMVGSGRAVKMRLYDDNGPNIALRKKFFQKLNLFGGLRIDVVE